MKNKCIYNNKKFVSDFYEFRTIANIKIDEHLLLPQS